MEPILSQQLFAPTRGLLGLAKTPLSLEEAVYGPLFLLSVVQFAHSTQENELHRDPTSIPWSDIRHLLTKRYRNIARYAERLLTKLPNLAVEKFIADVIDIYRHSREYDAYALSTLYIRLKGESRSNIPCSVRETASSEKVSGRELLLRTQFFTEPHMVRFLVRKAFAIASDGNGFQPDSFPAVIDPAVGSSNFLIGALLEGVKLLEGHKHTRKSRVEHVSSRLYGYELDPLLAEFGALNLDLAIARLSGALPHQRPAIYAGRAGDELGFLSEAECDDFRAALPNGRRLLLTNPPFLGRRMMSLELKRFIKTTWPESKGDLCTAFTLCCLDVMRPNDVLGLVHQNALFHLSSLVSAKTRLLTQCAMIESVDLGAGAFESLSGEKANVSLSLFQRGAHLPMTRLVDLADLSYGEKVSALDDEQVGEARVSNVDANAIKAQCSIALLRTRRFHGAWNSLPTYGQFASPMQGTSTGDNQKAVRYSWEIPATEEAWVPASKGGGFAKWWGLNRYVVWWGREGETLRTIQGSALRNVDKQATTQLVFSDTGTAGLNVRRLRSGQVFIASGPGIYVRDGDPYAHLAFLNSRVATYFIRGLNPKLTVSAGYLKRLPFSERVATSATLSHVGMQCVNLKRNILETKLGSDDFNFEKALPAGEIEFDEYFRNAIAHDLNLELTKLELEAQIESEVHSAFDFSEHDAIEIRTEVGIGAGEIASTRKPIDIALLDALLCRYLSVGLNYRNGVKLPGGIAADGTLEAAALTTKRAPFDIVAIAQAAVDDLRGVRRIYLNDLLHKLVLSELGFSTDRGWNSRTTSIRNLCDRIVDRVPGINGLLRNSAQGTPTLRTWLESALARLHAEAFWGHPIVWVSDGRVALARLQ